VRLLRPDLNDMEELLWLERMEMAGQGRPRDTGGVERILEHLPEKYWTVVTSATERLARSRMEAGGVRVPAQIVSADMVTHGKPHPEPYRKGAELLGLSPSECLSSRTQLGCGGGRAAGCQVMATLYSHSLERLIHADWWCRRSRTCMWR